jgi:tRNA A-37 threonylcarbamoyl transferase component Bud32
MQNPLVTNDEAKDSALIFDRIDGITLGNVATLKNAVSVRCKALKQLKGTICLMHAQLVIHMNLYPGNVMPQCPQDEEIIGGEAY